ncbi:MAG: PorP/SprF family type IX secretion system membrane protein, partial [Bacteroidetes bacterium]|nr:PorP/SprF family type IX secretion system membrane protein [Bacteroidota bacterium]
MNNLLQLRAKFYVLGFLLLAVRVGAQDIHFTQFHNSPLNLNAGLVGVYGGDGRAVVNYKSQWRSVPVPYTTYSGSLEGKLYLNKGVYSRFLSGGVLLNQDDQGDLHLKSLLIGLPIGLTVPVGKANYLTFGVMPAFGQRRFDSKNVTFDSQWQNRVFSPNNDAHEDQLLANTNLKYFDLNAGMNFRLQSPKNRNRLDIGYGMQHINRPAHDFYSSSLTDPGTTRLRSKSTVYLCGLVQLQHNFDLIGSMMWNKQGGARELVYGLSARFHLIQTPYKEMALQVGMNRRHYYNDAIVPHVEFLYRTITVGFTYDINWLPKIGNVNPPANKVITNGRGGPELG